MKMDSVSPEGGQAEQPAVPFGFLNEKLFWLTAVIMLCYLSIESSVMGWIVTYFIDSGAATESSAQMLTALLWIVILIGRSACVVISNKVAPPQFVVVASIGIAAFLVVVLVSPGFVPLLIGTIGLGLCMAGMYGTTVSNATDVFKQYPLAMGVFVTVTGIGSVIVPSAIGAVAGQFGMRAGLGVLLLPAVLLILFALYNFKTHK
ncbi:MAG: MFS transporter, partial [Butyricicoccus sp.]